MACSSAGVGDRKILQRFLACLVVRALPRVFSGTAEQHSHLDGLLFHRAIPPGRGTHRARYILARDAHRIAFCRFFVSLLSSGKGQKNAQESWSINTPQVMQAWGTRHKPFQLVAALPEPADECVANRWRALASSSVLDRWGVWSVSSSTTSAQPFSAIIRRCNAGGI